MSEEIKIEEKVEEPGIEPEVVEEVKEEVKEESPAKKFGHMSFEEWKEAGKDPEDYKGSNAFIKDGELHGKLKSQAKELDNIKNVLRQMNEKLTKAEEIAYKKAIEDLKKERNEAIQLGEIEKADKLEARADEIKRSMGVPATPIPPQNPFTEASMAWIRSRQATWFNDSTPTNIIMSAEAKNFDSILASQHPEMNIVDRFNLVEEKVKAIFPQQFSKKEARAPMVSSAKSVDKPGDKRVPSYRDLPDATKKIVETMSKAMGTSREEYIKQLQDKGVL